MAISYVSGASAASTTVTMPTHAAGDLLLAFAFRSNSTTGPTIPAGWLGGYAIPGANTCSIAMGYKIATSSSEVTGTWTNATSITVVVYRKATSESWTTPTVMFDYASSATIDYSASYYIGSYHTIRQPNTEVWYARFAGHAAATNLTTNTPTGWTARTGLATGVRAMDTDAPVLIDNDTIGTVTQTVDTSGGWFAVSVRIEVWDGTGIVCMGSDGGDSSSTVMPLVAAGDMILMYGSRANDTPPSLPSGYTDLSNGGADTFSSRLAYKIATSSSETIQTMTNATYTTISVYRAGGKWDIATSGLGTSTNGNTATMTYTGAAVNPVQGMTIGYVRFETANQAYGLLYPGWVLRGMWNTTPAVATRDALNIKNPADVVGFGVNSATLPGGASAWRTDTVRLVSTPYIAQENINLTNQAIPSNSIGCYVTLIGGGGGGCRGRGNGGGWSVNKGGGGGGGGGGRVQRVFIPVGLLGSTYSVTVGEGGASHSSGTLSQFTSGSIVLTANGGSAGVNPNGQSGGSGGAGGTASATGITATTLTGGSGTKGGDGHIAASRSAADANDETEACPGGGGGGGKSSGGTNGSGGAGGNSSYADGGTASGNAGDHGGAGNPGGGGGGGSGSASGTDGGAGGDYGAGGGGGGAGSVGSSFASYGGVGGSGYTLVEWVPADSSQFFQAFGPV